VSEHSLVQGRGLIVKNGGMIRAVWQLCAPGDGEESKEEPQMCRCISPEWYASLTDKADVHDIHTDMRTWYGTLRDLRCLMMATTNTPMKQYSIRRAHHIFADFFQR
jgi:hypothetical protein